MISPNTIQAIRELSVEDVVSQHVELKQRKGCCPFHHEKTPSFSVNPARNIFKCFGCGEGGDSIKFTQLILKLSFYEAIEHLAKQFNIEIEYIETKSPEEKKKDIDKLNQAKEILDYAHRYYRSQLNSNPSIKQILLERGIDDTIIDEEMLGFAPDDYKNITTHIVNNGWYEVAIEIGLIRTKQGTSTTYDVFRNRIIIPLNDAQGQLIGFAGRAIGDEQPKYLNPNENFLYAKKETLYGMDVARQSIAEEKNCYLVEGYFDVLSLRKQGVMNVVAACGTAVDDKHLNQIKRFTNTITLFPDGDAAGKKALTPLIHRCVKLGFVTMVSIVDGKDPDEIAREFIGNNI